MAQVVVSRSATHGNLAVDQRDPSAIALDESQNKSEQQWEKRIAALHEICISLFGRLREAVSNHLRVRAGGRVE